MRTGIACAAPVVSQVAANAVPSGSGTVTISGISFVTVDLTATASLATADVCGSSAWTSATTLACLSHDSGVILMGASVTVAVVSGTGKPSFSFDGALPFAPLSDAVQKWSCLCSAGREQGCDQRRSERQRHSHD